MKKNFIIITLMLLSLTSAFSLTLKEKLEAYTGKTIRVHIKDSTVTSNIGSSSSYTEMNYNIMFVGNLTEIGDGYIVVSGRREIFKGKMLSTPSSSDLDLDSYNQFFIIPMDQIVYFDSTTNE